MHGQLSQGSSALSKRNSYPTGTDGRQEALLVIESARWRITLSIQLVSTVISCRSGFLLLIRLQAIYNIMHICICTRRRI